MRKPMKSSRFASLLPIMAIALASPALPARANNLAHVHRLLSQRECIDCDLSRAGLTYADLTGVNLQGSTLRMANLSQSVLAGADLRNTNLVGAVLFDADLSGADLRGADLRGADLRGAFLGGANLDGAFLEGAFLMGAYGLPDNVATADTLYEWGLVQSESGNYEMAANYFTQSLALEADNPQIHLGRSLARFQLGDLERAYADAKQAETLFLAAGDEANAQNATTMAEGIEEVQRRIIEGPEPPPPSFLNFVGSLASILLRLAL
ncbi:MAG: pentapeptide repeat-containing protein [Elainellaceae cyanobacterium]